ncbi:RNA polymerase sigma factor [Planctomycetota bacterium]
MAARLNDEELMRGVQADDHAAFRQLVQRYLDRCVSFTFTYLRDRDTAQEITQRTLVEIYQKRNQYKLGTSFPSWLFTMLRRRCLDYLRREQKLQTAVDGEITLIPDQRQNDPLEALIKKEDELELYRRLKTLPLHYQESLYLRYYQALPMPAIAAVMGKSSKAVEQYILLAIKKLRQ